MIKSKKGVTLVELIAAVAVIAIVVVGTVSGVVLAQQNILNDSLKEQASLKAQQVADTLVEKMSGKPYTDNYASAAAIPSSELEGAAYSMQAESNFPNSRGDGEIQFAVYEMEAKNNASGISSGIQIAGTRILVAGYYKDNSYITVEAFAPERTAPD